MTLQVSLPEATEMHVSEALFQVKPALKRCPFKSSLPEATEMHVSDVLFQVKRALKR